jgi:hypothetical protein
MYSNMSVISVGSGGPFETPVAPLAAVDQTTGMAGLI